MTDQDCTRPAAVGLVRAVMVIAMLAVLAHSAAGQASPASPSLRAIEANDNRVPAGRMEAGVLTLRLEITAGNWYPEAENGTGMMVDSFAEEGKPPQIPGPLIRVPQNTEIRITVHNLLRTTAVLHGLHDHPGDAKETIEVAPGETREVRFRATQPGTYQYFASAGGELNRGRPFRDDSQLHGAFIVDPPGAANSDRVFVMGVWRSETKATLSKDVAVINGKSWPYTERLSYAAGERVRWRWINASDLNHPMHMHGSYYQVEGENDGEHELDYPPAEQRSVVTQLILPGSAITTSWSAVAGRWIFHCHILPHVAPSRTVAVALSPDPESLHDHGSSHMGGLVMGITVSGERQPAASRGKTRKLRLEVVPRPPMNGLRAGFAFRLEPHHGASQKFSVPGPPLILERGRPVEITVENRLPEPTAVHWHGMELQSYYDGVTGWGMQGKELTPMIAPGKAFCARFTPPRAGTFIYHTHLDDELQLTGGLYGPLIVLEPGARFDAGNDQILVISGSGGPRSAYPRDELKALVNGSSSPPALHWRAHQRYHLRVINISSAITGIFSLHDNSGTVKWRPRAKDGAELPARLAVLQDATQPSAPGETYDFDFEPQSPGRLNLNFRGLVLPVEVTQAIEVE